MNALHFETIECRVRPTEKQLLSLVHNRPIVLLKVGRPELFKWAPDAERHRLFSVIRCAQFFQRRPHKHAMAIKIAIRCCISLRFIAKMLKRIPNSAVLLGYILFTGINDHCSIGSDQSGFLSLVCCNIGAIQEDLISVLVLTLLSSVFKFLMSVFKNRVQFLYVASF